MNMVLRRIFGVSTRLVEPVIRAPLPEIRQSLRQALDGCNGVGSDRLLYNIHIAKTPTELWALRSDLHQCIAQVHTESVATQRINALNQVFAGWVPAEQLAKIHPVLKPSEK